MKRIYTQDLCRELPYSGSKFYYYRKIDKWG